VKTAVFGELQKKQCDVYFIAYYMPSASNILINTEHVTIFILEQ